MLQVIVPKMKGEPLGVVIVESGWGSMVPTVVLANMLPNGPAARCGQLNIGDQIISINGVSLVGLPLSACQTYVKVGHCYLACYLLQQVSTLSLSLCIFFSPPSFPLPLCLDREVACASNVASCGWTRMTFIKINIKHFWKTTRRSLNEMHFR